jgi:predicted nucleic acid-binding protein
MVIDASVLLNALFPDEQQLEAQNLIRDYVAGVATLSAPTLLGYEITNAVWQAERRQRISCSQAEAILSAYDGLQIPLYGIDWQTVLTMSRQFNRSAYDAAYLVLAQSSSDTLVTGDLRLYNAVKDYLNWIIWIGDYQSTSAR